TTETETQLRGRRDRLMLQANNMLQLADSLGEFQSVDIARLEREIHERETWIEEATAQNPDYVAITAALEKARAAFGDASERARDIGNKLAVDDHKIKEQTKRLLALDGERGERGVPLSAWRGYRHVALEIDRRADIFVVDPEAGNALGDGIWEGVRG